MSVFCNRVLFVCAAAAMAGILSLSSPAVMAEDSFSDKQKQDIEKLIHKYIQDNPDVILQAVQRLREERELARRAHAQAAVKNKLKQLASDPSDPVAGNPKGDVTIVEFFDYRCGYCKRVLPTMQKLMHDDKGIKIVYKEFPILGPESMLASRAALAVWRTAPEKYQAFHDTLMASRSAVSEAKIMGIAKKLGLDTAALKRFMGEKDIDAKIAENFKLAESISVNGTPAFVIGGELVPGAADISTFKRLIAQARGS